MSNAAARYVDTNATIYGQMQYVLVVCPRCHACARITVRLGATTHPDCFTPRRVVCPACSYVKEWEGGGLHYDWYASPMRDCWFGLPLWLQTRCCGHVLWAYNREHLYIMEQYVAAHLREQEPNARGRRIGWRSKTLVNRLPEWMIVAGHRRAVLHAIKKLKVV